MTDPWARPANEVPPGQQPPAGEQPTQQIPQHGRAPEPPTQQAPHYGPPQGAPPQGPPAQNYPPPQNYPPGAPPDAGGPPPPPKRGSFVKRMFGDPLSIVLVFVIVLALVIAGVVGAELYARHRADSVVAKATECVVQDKVSVSFGATPFLLQHMTGHYGNISISTAGNQIREAKGMKADIHIDDVRLGDGNSPGTIGALDATITWSADGIKQTIQNAIPLVGSFVTGVTTNPSNGTIELEAALGSIITKPKIVDNGISLEVEELTGLGFTLPREAVQPALDAFSSQLTKNYPLGIHADSIEVTDSGVISKFSTQNATIPQGGEDPCFAGV